MSEQFVEARMAAAERPMQQEKQPASIVAIDLGGELMAVLVFLFKPPLVTPLGWPDTRQKCLESR